MPTNAPSIKYDGSSLSTHGLLLLRGPYPGAPPYRIDVQGIPYRHGGVSLGSFTEPRNLECQVLIQGDDPDDTLANRDAVFNVLNTDRERALLFENTSIEGRQWYARLREASFDRWLGGTGMTYRLTFSASDPTAYAATATETVEDIESDPDSYTITPGGNLFAEPVWEIKNTGASATSSGTISLSNAATGESIGWGGSIPAGGVLRVDAKRWIVELDSGSGFVPVMSGLDASDQFPTLLPGVSNSITVGGVATGELTVTYRDRWLG